MLTPWSMFAPDVYVATSELRFFGLEVGARMTALKLRDGVLIHSPLALAPSCAEQLGQPRWVVAPNMFHHLYVGPWIEAGLEGFAAPGLEHKRPELRFTAVLSSPKQHPFGPEVEVLPLRCFPLSNEVVLLHKPSGTLLVTDLVFNFSPAKTPRFTRAAMRCMCGYPGCQTTLLERVAMRRAAAREDLNTILSWDFDRMIMAHGEPIERDAKASLRHAFRWLM